MKLAYLVNQYPQLSHSFIRREIQALEQLGQPVERVSIRPVGDCLDPADQAEAKLTWSILSAGWINMLMALILTLLHRPASLARAWCMATRLGWRSGRGTLRHWVYLAEACLLVRRAQLHHIDHVHAHFGTNPAMVALLARLLGGPSYSFTVHGPEEFDRPESLGLREKVQHAAFVVAISDYGRSQIFRWIDPKDWQRIHVVRCGVDASFLEAPRAPFTDTPRFVCVGRLCEQKGQMLLVQAMARLRDKGVPCEATLVGEGPMRGVLETEIAQRNLRDRVFLLGAMAGPEVRKAIQTARAFVLPSFAEGLPVVIMEALALGRPVVSTYVAGIPELVETGGVGWLVPAGSLKGLVQALEQVLTTPLSELQRMGDRGNSRVRLLHNVPHEAKKLLELFSLAVHEPKAQENAMVVGDLITNGVSS